MTANDGRQAGRLTSSAMSPALGRPIALATLLRDFTEPGARVTLEDGTTATVTALPFAPLTGEQFLQSAT